MAIFSGGEGILETAKDYTEHSRGPHDHTKAWQYVSTACRFFKQFEVVPWTPRTSRVDMITLLWISGRHAIAVNGVNACAKQAAVNTDANQFSWPH